MKLATKLKTLLEESLKDYIKKTYKVEDKDFEKAHEDDSVNTIVKTKKGYVGFSHRAVAEFKIGDMLFDDKWTGDLEEDELEKVPFIKRGSIKIKTMDQAKKAAINFAEYVS